MTNLTDSKTQTRIKTNFTEKTVMYKLKMSQCPMVANEETACSQPFFPLRVCFYFA